MSVLVIAEHNNQVLAASTLNTVTAAIEIAGHAQCPVDILVAGFDCELVVQACANIPGIARVRVVNSVS